MRKLHFAGRFAAFDNDFDPRRATLSTLVCRGRST
jgi:hypothetical protein